jgi:uncharacterized protein involved in type VI secretion and phage assembly
MTFLNGLEDPLSEVTDALSDFGLEDEAESVEEATRIIQAAVAQNGVPTPRARFLIGPPADGTVPTDHVGWEEAITHAGHVLDGALQAAGLNPTGNAPIPLRLLGINPNQGGYGELAAAIINRQLGQEQKYDLPHHWVDSFYVEEGISRCWRAIVVLSKPLASQAPPVPGAGPLDFAQLAQNAFTDQAGDGWDMADLGDLGTFGRQVGQAINNPGQAAGQTSDSPDPDAIDQPNLPTDHAVQQTLPQGYLGQFARLCVARRFARSKFTLNERWFSGVVTAFEDLGLDANGFRSMRVTIRPRLWQLSLRRRYRMFKNKNAVEIVLQLLEEHGIYPREPADSAPNALRLAPGGRELFGPVGVPDALTAAVDKIASGLPFGVGEGVGKSINEVLQQPIEDWRPKREYCVQYGETDLEFIERLLAEEGLSYFFENRERRETLVICEDPRLAGKKVLTAGRLPLAAFAGANANPPTSPSESILSLVVTRVPVPSGVTLRDRSYVRPYDAVDLKAGESISLLSPSGVSSLTTAGGLAQMASQALGLATELAGTPGTEDYAGPEAQLFEYPARLAFPAKPDEPLPYEAYDGPPMAQLRLEAHRAQGLIARGTSDCATLAPGSNVRIDGMGFDVLHPAVQKPQRFLVTAVVHTGNVSPAPAGGTTGAPGIGYSNSFEAINVGVPYRPMPIAKPRIAGVQTAIVIDTKLGEDPSGNPGEVDVAPTEHAWRVRVRFPWERGDPRGGESENGSPWLRFATPFSGAGFGAMFVPRVGMEVVVGFDEGDPDRPYVLGAVYASAHAIGPGTRHASVAKPAAPDGERVPGRIDDPARRTESGLVSRSWPQDEVGEGVRGNRLRFEDTAGNERIRVYAQRDLAEEVGEDHVTSVLRDQENLVVGDQREVVGGDQTLLARYPSDPNDLGMLDWGRSVEIKIDEEVRIGGGGGASALMHDQVKGNDVSFVGPGGHLQKVMRNEHIQIEGEGSTEDRPARLLMITKDSDVTIEMDDRFEVTGDRKILAKGAHSIEAATIAVQTKGPADAGGRSEVTGGLTMDEKGVSLASSGSARFETNFFTAESTEDRVLVKAKTKIYIHDDQDNAILLDAETRTIVIQARTGMPVKFASEPSQITLTKDSITMASGPSEWTTSIAADGTLSEMKGPTATFEAKDEIHLNAPVVALGE